VSRIWNKRGEHFLHEYNQSPERWHSALFRECEKFEKKTLVGLKMRIHRLSIQEGIGCAVRRSFFCPMYLPGARNFQDQIACFWYEDKILSDNLRKAIHLFESRNADVPIQILSEALTREIQHLQGDQVELTYTLNAERQKLATLREECDAFLVKFGSSSLRPLAQSRQSS
jgi:hypothetical protein